MSRTAAATPRRDDTLTPRYLSDRRGAPAGGRIRLSSGPTWLLHHAPCGVTTAERIHAPGEVPGGDAHAARAGDQCVRAQRHGDARSAFHRGTDDRLPFVRHQALGLTLRELPAMHRAAPAEPHVEPSLREDPECLLGAVVSRCVGVEQE
jgi:hypothetical protein